MGQHYVVPPSGAQCQPGSPSRFCCSEVPAYMERLDDLGQQPLSLYFHLVLALWHRWTRPFMSAVLHYAAVGIQSVWAGERWRTSLVTPSKDEPYSKAPLVAVRLTGSFASTDHCCG
ncbi:unnamed protein product, partial [Ectocarpus sp. 12 AP-2014]